MRKIRQKKRQKRQLNLLTIDTTSTIVCTRHSTKTGINRDGRIRQVDTPDPAIAIVTDPDGSVVGPVSSTETSSQLCVGIADGRPCVVSHAPSRKLVGSSSGTVAEKCPHVITLAGYAHPIDSSQPSGWESGSA